MTKKDMIRIIKDKERNAWEIYKIIEKSENIDEEHITLFRSEWSALSELCYELGIE